MARRGHTAPNLGRYRRVGQALELSKLPNVGEDDLRKRRAIDHSADDHRRPPGGHRLVGGPSGLQHLVPEKIGLDDVSPELAEPCRHRRLPRADSTRNDETQRRVVGPLLAHPATVALVSVTTIRQPWEQRLDWLLSVLLWAAFGLGMFLSLAFDGRTTGAMIAGIAVAAYTVTMQIVPRPIRHSDNVGELLAVSGVLISLLAVALTDGIGSPYLLFLATPSFFAGAFLGYRIGIETALLTSAGLIGVVATLDQAIVQGQVIQIVLLYVLIAATFAQARRVLVEERAVAAEVSMHRVGRLKAAHAALISLQELAGTADLNPVSVGRAALRDLALLVPYEAGQVVLLDEEGPVVVASRGPTGDLDSPTLYPMEVGSRRLGHLALWPADGDNLSTYRGIIEELLRPVVLAFDNIALLRSVAARAVQEERARLARDLHDDLGPSLASLGLGLDSAILEDATGEHLARRLETMRRSVTDLVERIRQIAADLRHDPQKSLIEQANRIAAEIGADGPAVIVDIDERRPPRPVIAGDLGAIMQEAIRNATLHAGARSIRLEGYVDRERGELSIIDDGRGFDPGRRSHGRFGLIGIEERADEIGARISIDSAPGKGSRVTVKWGPE